MVASWTVIVTAVTVMAKGKGFENVRFTGAVSPGASVPSTWPEIVKRSTVPGCVLLGAPVGAVVVGTETGTDVLWPPPPPPVSARPRTIFQCQRAGSLKSWLRALRSFDLMHIQGDEALRTFLAKPIAFAIPTATEAATQRTS